MRAVEVSHHAILPKRYSKFDALSRIIDVDGSCSAVPMALVPTPSEGVPEAERYSVESTRIERLPSEHEDVCRVVGKIREMSRASPPRFAGERDWRLGRNSTQDSGSCSGTAKRSVAKPDDAERRREETISAAG